MLALSTTDRLGLPPTPVMARPSCRPELCRWRCRVKTTQRVAILIANSGNGLPNATIALQGSETNGHATLAGTGIFGPVDLAGGPINISPGDGGIGALAIGTLDDTSITGTGAKFNFELGSTSDQLIVNGSIDIGFSSRLNLQTVAGFAPTEGDILFLINNDGVDAFGGRFSAYPEGLEFSLGGSLLKSTYAADASANSFTAGNDFAVKVIPEPSAVGMLALAATALLARRKRPAARQLALPIPHTRIASN